MASTEQTIGIPLYEGVNLLDFGGAVQVFSLAGSEEARLRSVLLGARAEAVQTSAGVRVLPHASFADCPPLDVVFVPGGGEGVAAAMGDEALLGFLRHQATGARFVCSVGTGSLLLAAAGLLEGYEATTYWNALPALQRFPGVKVVPGHPRWWIDRDRITGAGASSALDEALQIAALLLGTDAAKRAQLATQYAPAPPFQEGDPSTADTCTYLQVSKAQRAVVKAWQAAADQARSARQAR